MCVWGGGGGVGLFFLGGGGGKCYTCLHQMITVLWKCNGLYTILVCITLGYSLFQQHKSSYFIRKTIDYPDDNFRN